MAHVALDLIAALVGVVLPAGAALQQRGRKAGRETPEEITTSERLSLYWVNSAILALLGAVAAAAWVGTGLPLADLGLRPPLGVTTGLGLAALFLVGYGIDSWRQLTGDRLPATRARWRRDTPFMPTGAREQRHALVLVLAASIAEELLYRGFLISWLQLHLGTSPAAVTASVVLPALVFGAGHVYQRSRAVIRIVALSTVFGAIFVLTGSIWIPIALHLAVDLQAVLLAPRLLAGSGETPPQPAP